MQSVSEYYRYCPDQPKVLLSDSVCRARQRNGYPQCPTCRFADQMRSAAGAGGPGRGEVAAEADALARLFCDSGVRARCPEDLDDVIGWRLGHAIASYLRGALRGLDRGDSAATTVLVGRDMRPTSPMLAAALIEGARSTGANVVDLGPIDTPQLYFAVNHIRSCGGVQVTGSRMPVEINGLKIAGQQGRPIGPGTGLADIGRIAQNMVKHETGQQGILRSCDLTHEYRAFIRSQLRAPRPLKFVVDASNGMAGPWTPIALGDVPGLELVGINLDHDGDFAHPPDPLVDDHLAQLRGAVTEAGADFGVCFDGDADRVVFVDEAGEVVRNDILTALLARHFLTRHPGSTIVYDLRSSRVVEEEIKAAGGVPRRERAGSDFIKKALTESKGVFAGTPGGRFYFQDNHFCDSALLAVVHLINLLTEQARPLGALVRPLDRYARARQTFDNPQPDASLRKLADVYTDARVDFLDGVTVRYPDWWFNVRRESGQNALTLNLESQAPDLLDKKLDELSGYLGSPVRR